MYLSNNISSFLQQQFHDPAVSVPGRQVEWSEAALVLLVDGGALRHQEHAAAEATCPPPKKKRKEKQIVVILSTIYLPLFKNLFTVEGSQVEWSPAILSLAVGVAAWLPKEALQAALGVRTRSSDVKWCLRKS